MKKLALVGALILLAVGSALAQDGTMMKSDPAASDAMKSDNAMKSSGDTMMKSDTVMRATESEKKMAMDPMDSTAYNLKGLGSQVVPFTSEKAAQMLAKNQTVVYFFAATWCPDCQATYKDIKANFGQIPKNVTVVFVNYDKASELKKKYGITQQHTFVVIGPSGERKRLFAGATTVADLVKSATAM